MLQSEHLPLLGEPHHFGRPPRAAEYLRMSTDQQKYSTENQSLAIAVFAAQRGIDIVRTYIDEGRSGLSIANRSGLAALIDDVQSGRADFEYVLVYDVSRWGRFQDVDESAYYEFICRRAGVQVHYCAEEFENDGSLTSSLIKVVARFGAADYSRRLSRKGFRRSMQLGAARFLAGRTARLWLAARAARRRRIF